MIKCKRTTAAGLALALALLLIGLAAAQKSYYLNWYVGAYLSVGGETGFNRLEREAEAIALKEQSPSG